jgi:sulfoxide reductase heme-binding subunit YedZ
MQPGRKQIAWIKAALFVAALIPLVRLFWLGFNDALTANPVEFVERSTGTWALISLLVALSMTPVRLLTGFTWQIQLRRMAGLFMYFYACLHFATYIWLDHWFFWDEIVADIIKHPYVLVGFSAFVLATPLALTSNRAAMLRLGPNWKRLHMLVYPIAILAVLHFWWLVKKDIREPLLYAVILAVLLGIRLYYRKSGGRAHGIASAAAKPQLGETTLKREFIMSPAARYYLYALHMLDRFAPVIPPFFLRLLLAWEYGEAGHQKFVGENWFADLTFPFPFNLLPPDISWGLAIFFELAGAVALVLGLGTRFFSLSLMILTVVAIASVHWPDQWSTFGELLRGYRIIDEEDDGFGNYKLPAIYLVMFLPLLFGGAGKLSVDYLLRKRCELDK